MFNVTWCKHWWLRVKLNTETISKLFQNNFISHVTTVMVHYRNGLHFCVIGVVEEVSVSKIGTRILNWYWVPDTHDHVYEYSLFDMVTSHSHPIPNAYVQYSIIDTRYRYKNRYWIPVAEYRYLYGISDQYRYRIRIATGYSILKLNRYRVGYDQLWPLHLDAGNYFQFRRKYWNMTSADLQNGRRQV